MVLPGRCVVPVLKSFPVGVIGTHYLVCKHRMKAGVFRRVLFGEIKTFIALNVIYYPQQLGFFLQINSKMYDNRYSVLAY